MKVSPLGERILARLDPRLAGLAERVLRRVPWLAARVQSEVAEKIKELEPSLKPYRHRFVTFTRLPEQGRDRDEILREVESMVREETPRWREGLVSGAVYHGAPEHIAFLARVAEAESQSNPLHSDLWPSVTKFEAEIVSMSAALLGGEPGEENPERRIVGAVTSGGTESILMAMKAYRDRAIARGNSHPEIVAPVTAHAAFDKAAQYFRMRIVRVPVGEDFTADVEAMRRAMNRRTVVLVASAPQFPHGLIDPVSRLSELALERRVGLHVDACLGGFVLPFARKLGYPVPPFDFQLPGVTSMSADTHKYAYASKGTSVVLYRGASLRSFQYFTATDWPGGLYFSPTIAGSRPGALSAAAWAAMLAMGESGYLEAARRILEAAQRVKDAVRAVPELQLIGDPLFVAAFTSSSVDVYRVMDGMAKRGWNLNGLHRPSAVHLAVTLRHAEPGVTDRFRDDLAAAVAEAKGAPPEHGGMAPIYGMAASMPFRGVVSDVLKAYLDMLYDP